MLKPRRPRPAHATATVKHMSTTNQNADERRNQPGEVLISGLDTGPSPDERDNLSPTEELMTLTPETEQAEPEDEDG